MAGSRDWFIYTSDTGQRFVVNLDESNAEAAGFPHFQLNNVAEQLPTLPANMDMRFVYAYNTATPDIRRRFYVPTLAALTTFLQTRQIGAQTYPGTAPTPWTISTYRGERRRKLPVVLDTGLNDGDFEG